MNAEQVTALSHFLPDHPSSSSPKHCIHSCTPHGVDQLRFQFCRFLADTEGVLNMDRGDV